jgi:hypothetical protein
LRKRLPTAAVALVCVAALAAAISGAVSPMPALDFVNQGHWVYNTVLRAALHIDGATAQVDAKADVTSDPGSMVLQGESSGYVVGKSGITVFGKSSLAVEGKVAAPSDEMPLGLQVPGSPYLVYRKAGKIVRLGQSPVTVVVGGPVADAVYTPDGTLWLYRQDNGAFCPLPKDADTVTQCPAGVPTGHTGAMTVVGNQPMFLDTTSGMLLPFGTGGMGRGVPIGVTVSAQARPAPTDIAGKVAILDPPAHTMHLVDPAGATPPVTVPLPEGDYSGPTSTGAAIAVVDRRSDTVLTYDAAGKPRDTKALPTGSGEPRLVRGEDSRVYVEGASGTHVMVVDKDGAVTDVPVVAPNTEDKDKAAPPASPGEQPTPARPERDERTSSPPPSSSDSQGGEQSAPPRTEQPQQPPVLPPSPPGAPKSVAATGADASATVTWGPAASNRATISQYRVSWSGGSRIVSGSARSAKISGLANGTRYTFTVAALNSAGRGPAAASNAVTPAAAASAPRSVTADLAGTTATVRFSAPADLGGGTLQHYTVSGTGLATKTVTGTTTTFTGLPSTGGQKVTFTVKAVTRTADGQNRTGAGASASVTVPNQSMAITPGESSQSANCEAPDCRWINVTLTGLEPNTTYSIHGWANGHEFTAPVDMTTDASGSATCADNSCDRIRYDVPDTDVYFFTTVPSGRLQSNTLSWEAG